MAGEYNVINCEENNVTNCTDYLKEAIREQVINIVLLLCDIVYMSKIKSIIYLKSGNFLLA